MPSLWFIDFMSWIGLLGGYFPPSETVMASSGPEKLVLREETFSLVLAQEPLGPF